MAIDQLTICVWEGRRCRHVDIASPTWEQVEAAVRALNGCDRNDLYLTPDGADPETYLCVGGGAGQYVVFGSIGNETFPTVVSQAESRTDNARLMIGGQEGLYPLRWVVDLPEAICAARAFWQSGQFRGGSLTWENV